MMDFTGVKAITIPEGEVKKIVNAAGTVLWEAQAETPQIDYIDYLENTSNSNRIDTGFRPNNNATLSVEVEALDTTAYRGIAGCRDTTNSFCFFTNTATWRCDRGASQSVSSYNVVVGDRVTLTLDKNLFKINGIQYNDFANTTFQVEQNLWLLGVNNRGSAMSAMAQKFYGAQVYDNDVLVRNFRPCKDGSGVICMHESCENKYYYLDGTNRAV